MTEHGQLDIPDDDLAALAARISANLLGGGDA